MINSRKIEDLHPKVAAMCKAFVDKCDADGIDYFGILCFAVVNAFSMLQPSLPILHLNELSSIFNLSAHSETSKVSPLKAIG